MDKDKRMAQFSVIVPDDLGELINQISKETGRSISSLCADYLQEGVYRHVEQLNRVEVWRSQTNERQKSKGEAMITKIQPKRNLKKANDNRS
jgi:predicted DNA-binding protein